MWWVEFCMAKDQVQIQAEELFKKISKRANLHGHSFTMMALTDKQVIELIAAELRQAR